MDKKYKKKLEELNLEIDKITDMINNLGTEANFWKLKFFES